jgi:hypothetical protein
MYLQPILLLILVIVFNWQFRVKSYDINVSSDSSDWQTVFSVTGGSRGLIDSVVFNPVAARYVLIKLNESSTSTGYGMSKLEVYENLIVHPPVSVMDEKVNEWRINCFPSPAKENLTINYSVGTSQHIRMEICNTEGRLIDTVLNEYIEEGNYRMSFTIGQLPGGVYYIHLISQNAFVTSKFIVIR